MSRERSGDEVRQGLYPPTNHAGLREKCVAAHHSVRERAWVIVVEGRAEIRSGDQLVDGVVGTLVTFEPGERHAVSSAEGARVLLILAPWPGPGHYPGGETS